MQYLKPVVPENSPKRDENVVQGFIYKFLPYWPLFIFLFVLGGGGAYFYLKYMAKPVYEITATILVEDQKKGADESQLLEALNISSNKIVDNEIEIVKSKELLKNVIDSLNLYAPVSEEGKFVSYSAYNTSPVTISANDPSAIPASGIYHINFAYDKNKKIVALDGKNYPLDEFVKTSYGVLKFSENPRRKSNAAGPLFFSLINPGQVLDNLYLGLSAAPASKLSSVINLTLRDEVPSRGEDVLNLLLYNYYKSAIDDKNSLARNTLSFVQERIDSVATQLDSIESNLQKFKNRNGVINLSQQGSMYLTNVGESDRKMTDLNMQLAMLDEVEAYVTKKDGSTGMVPSLNGIPNQQLLTPLIQKLYDAELDYARMNKTIPKGNPTMVALQNEINSMRPAILENVQNQRRALVAGRATLNSEIGRYTTMLSTIPQNEKQLLDISRQQAIKSDAYAFLLKKKEEAALAYAAMVTNSKTITNAIASFAPISPKKMFVYLGSIVAALLLGFGFVLIKETFTNKILFRTDIEDITDIPVVAEIMNVKGKNPAIIDTADHKQLSFIEQFHHLRFAMGLNNKLLKYKKILVTSGNSGEGKSFISNNLAKSLASSGKRVVMVDLDFRNPKTSALYQMTINSGLAEFFENGDISINEIIYSTEVDGLYVIPAGYAKSNPTDLLLKEDLEKLFLYLEQHFDYVIVDTAPVDPIIDAYIVSEYCDSILFVIRHGYSTKAMLESLQKSKKINALKNVYIVFNDIKSRGFLKKGYGFGYGYGSTRLYGERVYQTKQLAN